MAGDLRLDPGKREGTYQVLELAIKELDWVRL
jgi:hypothetical protein